ncbi:MAG: 2-hydroxyglutaryl-CoA dehydratase [Planctomycetia bacterium]|nr:2-hydroxyglutaryl-CoA dehydratase [Planctomycetia bacterium]
MTTALKDIPTFAQIDEQLRQFEADERRRLGLEDKAPTPWHDANPQDFRRHERQSTTLLIGGLTMAHDALLQAALQGSGYRVDVLDCPDTRALHLGKEFGNRGQCNPTYFTVGNLVKHLVALRDEKQVPVERIVKDYLFLTAGSCGPCRFGTYVTEYRKALRDAGFEGFRVMLFQQTGGLKQATGEDAGLEFTPRLFLMLLKACVAGDVINAMGYRIRPYEVVPGATDAAIEWSKQAVCEAFRRQTSVLTALRRSRRRFAAIEVDRLQGKPKVLIIGEFWAMTTEGDGNYRLQRFLELEGAEVVVQPITAWILYLVWQTAHDVRRRIDLRGADLAKKGLEGKDGRRTLVKLWAAERVVRLMFHTFAWGIGLADSHLADMPHIAELAREHYDLELRGGEGHMEVGKLIDAVREKSAHMVVSVKPFGCMPSSSVSDGVMAGVLARHPEAIFCAVETTGDGEVNFQSRVQMFLFKARQVARVEFAAALEQRGLTLDAAREQLKQRRHSAIAVPAHVVAGTGANQVYAL